MATKKSKSIDKVLAEAEAKIRSDLSEISGLVRRDFKNKAKDALVIYYDNYQPKMYERTENLLNNGINEDMLFDDFNVSGKDSYGAWVHFNAEDMNDYDIGDKYAVLDNFMYGIHGKEYIKIEKNPAMEIMGEYQHYYKVILDKYFTSRGFIVN